MTEQLFEQFKQSDILVIGDIMVDRYLFGQVDRISPEAPVPIVNLNRTEDRLGGAANVAINLAALGANPIMVGLIGDDSDGLACLKLLQSAQISDYSVLKSVDRPTTVKNRIWSRNQQILRFDQESKAYLNEDEEKRVLDQIQHVLDSRSIKAIVFQDYNKGVCSENIIRKVMVESITRDIPVIVDPKEKCFFTYKQCALFKPNLKEAVAQVETFPQEWTFEDVDRLGESLRKKLGNPQIMITLSDRGVYYNDGEESGIVSPQVRQIADVCGAGDSVLAIAVLGCTLGLSLKHIAALSNIAGGQVCEQPGVVPIDLIRFKQEVLANGNLKNYPMM